MMHFGPSLGRGHLCTAACRDGGCMADTGSSSSSSGLGAWRSRSVDSTLFTPHFTLCTSHRALHTFHPTLYTFHSSLHNPHFTLYTLRSPLSTPFSSHSTLWTPPPSTFHSLQCTGTITGEGCRLFK